VDDPAKLGVQADREISDPANPLFVSAGTIWETSIKAGLGKLSLSLPFDEWMQKAMGDPGAVVLDMTIAHAAAQARLPGRADPFDRLLAAQSIVEQLTVVSNDAGLDEYGIRRLW
jgi:PIN domain nuclease of toxin-antitoxin system